MNKNIKILIIEDELSVATIIEKVFQKNGIENILIAKDGYDGIAKVKESNPDLIILDLVLPGFNGIDILKKFQSQIKNGRLRFVVFSNLADFDHIKEAQDLGALDYFVKSRMGVNDIFKTVEKYLV